MRVVGGSFAERNFLTFALLLLFGWWESLHFKEKRFLVLRKDKWAPGKTTVGGGCNVREWTCMPRANIIHMADLTDFIFYALDTQRVRVRRGKFKLREKGLKNISLARAFIY